MIGTLLRATPTLFRVSFARNIAYRAEMTIWILTALMPLIMLALWNAVSKDNPIAGYGQTEMTRYFTTALIVRQMTGAWIIWSLNWEIRSGQLSQKLLRPVHPLWHDAIWTLSALPLRLIVLTPVIALLVFWRPELVHLPHPFAIPLFFVSVFLAWCLFFLFQAVIGMLAFWLDQTDGIHGVWFVLYSLGSGYIAPLEVFPESVRGLLDYLPFRSMMYTPVAILGGFDTPIALMDDVALQAAWVLVMLVVARAVWNKGVARYGAFGA